MKLTAQERKIHHKLSKWKYRNDLDNSELKIVDALKHQVGQKNIEVDLQQIANEYWRDTCSLLNRICDQNFNLSDIPEDRDFRAEALKQITSAFVNLQNLGFIEVVSTRNLNEHVVNVIPAWEK
jgi:hypothetical protein